MASDHISFVRTWSYTFNRTPGSLEEFSFRNCSAWQRSPNLYKLESIRKWSPHVLLNKVTCRFWLWFTVIESQQHWLYLKYLIPSENSAQPCSFWRPTSRRSSGQFIAALSYSSAYWHFALSGENGWGIVRTDEFFGYTVTCTGYIISF